MTSLVGTTGVDLATIVTLESNTFVGGNTGDDNVALTLGTAGQNASNYEVRMGGGDDTFTLNNTLLSSFIEMDGLTATNAGNDTFDGTNDLIINSEIRGMAGSDTFTNLALNGSTVNGNAGDDRLTTGASSASFVYGGQGTDVITVGAGTTASAMMLNGNRGSDTIVVGDGAAVNAAAADTAFSGSIHGGNGNDTINAIDTQVAGDLVTSTGVFISGDIGNDGIVGTFGVDTINGGDGDDTIDAGSGADIIDGGAGDDGITGGAGADVITTGTGNDAVTVASGSALLTNATANAGFDTITDFTVNTGGAGARNGDRILFGAAVNTVRAVDNIDGTATTSLGNALAGINFAAAGDLARVTITGAVSWSGNYLVYNAAGAAVFDVAADDVVKVNTFTGAVANTFA